MNSIRLLTELFRKNCPHRRGRRTAFLGAQIVVLHTRAVDRGTALPAAVAGRARRACARLPLWFDGCSRLAVGPSLCASFLSAACSLPGLAPRWVPPLLRRRPGRTVRCNPSHYIHGALRRSGRTSRNAHAARGRTADVVVRRRVQVAFPDAALSIAEGGAGERTCTGESACLST